MNAAVVVVGDEILSGHVRDANGHFIAQRLAAYGHRLRSISIVPDEPAAIADGVRRELVRAPIVFVCGGVGPTHDDRTMEGVAEAAGVPLEACEEIAVRIERLVERLRTEGIAGEPLGIDGLRKMAMVPRGAEALVCAGAFLPAVAVTISGRVVVVLPGPPRELENCFREAVEPRFLAGTGEAVYREEIAHPFPESSIARLLLDLERENAEVKIGSYPMEGYSLVRITGPRHAVDGVAGRLREEIEALRSSPEGRHLLAFFEGRRHDS